MPTKTIAEIKSKEKEVADMKESAKIGFLAAATEAIEQLGELGYHYAVKAVEGLVEPKSGQNRCSRCNGIGHSKRTCKEVEHVA